MRTWRAGLICRAPPAPGRFTTRYAQAPRRVGWVVNTVRARDVPTTVAVRVSTGRHVLLPGGFACRVRRAATGRLNDARSVTSAPESTPLGARTLTRLGGHPTRIVPTPDLARWSVRTTALTRHMPRPGWNANDARPAALAVAVESTVQPPAPVRRCRRITVPCATAGPVRTRTMVATVGATFAAGNRPKVAVTRRPCSFAVVAGLGAGTGAAVADGTGLGVMLGCSDGPTAAGVSTAAPAGEPDSGPGTGVGASDGDGWGISGVGDGPTSCTTGSSTPSTSGDKACDDAVPVMTSTAAKTAANHRRFRSPTIAHSSAGHVGPGAALALPEHKPGDLTGSSATGRRCQRARDPSAPDSSITASRRHRTAKTRSRLVRQRETRETHHAAT